jgi:hypothetical protein
MSAIDADSLPMRRLPATLVLLSSSVGRWPLAASRRGVPLAS